MLQTNSPCDMSDSRSDGRATLNRGMPKKEMASSGRVSLQSRIGLNATNFFLAEVTGVVLPFLNDFLKTGGWRYDAIGLATALAGWACS